jgi:hypothetical protein
MWKIVLLYLVETLDVSRSDGLCRYIINSLIRGRLRGCWLSSCACMSTLPRPSNRHTEHGTSTETRRTGRDMASVWIQQPWHADTAWHSGSTRGRRGPYVTQSQLATPSNLSQRHCLIVISALLSMVSRLQVCTMVFDKTS